MSSFKAHMGLMFCAFLMLGCSTSSVRTSTGPETSTAAPAPSQPSTSPASPASFQPPGPLGELSRLFVETYQAQRVEVKKEFSPVIVVTGSNLIFYQGEAKESVRVIPDIYHALKSVAHLPFAVYLRLKPFVDQPGELSETTIEQLQEIQSKITAARQALPAAGFSPEQFNRQLLILSASDALLAEVVRNRRTSGARLQEYTSLTGPLMLTNADEAGCAQILATHKQVLEWKKKMTCEEWDRLRVMNRGKHQARYRNAATQYFAWLFGEGSSSWSYQGESMRVIYSEFLGKEEESRDLLGTVLIDADASEVFFGDTWRLSEDILSRGAERCVKQLQDSDRFCDKSTVAMESKALQRKRKE